MAGGNYRDQNDPPKHRKRPSPSGVIPQPRCIKTAGPRCGTLGVIIHGRSQKKLPVSSLVQAVNDFLDQLHVLRVDNQSPFRVCGGLTSRSSHSARNRWPKKKERENCENSCCEIEISNLRDGRL